MNDMHLAALDLNLLRVFETLMEERSVTRAAGRLGLTQSAVSHALNRLRYALDDELFVRGPSGMRATPRAEEIAPGVLQGLHQLQSALAPSAFDPQESERRFTIGAGAYACTVLLPALVARMRVEAPHAELRVRMVVDGLADELDSGRLDVAIGAFSRVPDRYACDLLFTETSVWVVRRGHPAASRALTLDTLCELPHVIIASAEDAQVVAGSVVDRGLERRVIWDDGGVIRRALEERGRRPVVSLAVPDGQAALAVVAESDLAALLPRRLVKRFAGAFEVAAFEPPYPTVSTEMCMLWRRDHDAGALHWLRNLIRTVAGEL